MTREVSGRPEALVELERRGRALGDELDGAVSRAGAALEAFLASRPEVPARVDAALPAAVRALAADWRAADGLAGRTGARLEAADAGGLGGLCGTSALALAAGGHPAAAGLRAWAEATDALLVSAGRALLAGGDESPAGLVERLRRALDEAPLAPELVDFLAGDVANLWGGDGGGMPWGRWVAGTVRSGRGGVFVARGLAGLTPNPVPLFNNGAAGRVLQRAPGLRWLGGPAATTALRGAGIAGGLYTGISGTVDLVAQGNPVTALRREGAGYVADVAGTAFGYSSAAFLVAPNPVTGTVMVGTGVVWLGAEAWDHRDEVVEAVGDAAGWAGDRLGDAGGFVADVGGTAGRTVGGLADAVSFWN